MAALIALAMSATSRFSGLSGFAGQLIAVLVPAGTGILAYLALSSVLRIDEISRLRVLVQQRLRRPNLD
jgi:hypothetical protein